MSRAACGKQALCRLAEAAYAASDMTAELNPRELAKAEQAAEEFTELRMKLANRADAAANGEPIPDEPDDD